MAIYELRTYTSHVGKMAEAVKLYAERGYPALNKGGFDKKRVGYFQAGRGMLNQLVHVWKFDDDAHHRSRWATLFAYAPFIEGTNRAERCGSGLHNDFGCRFHVALWRFCVSKFQSKVNRMANGR